MGSLSRTKGANGERELARLLADELGTEVARNLTQAREGGADLLGVDGWAIEVKRAQKATRALLRAWWAQAEVQAEHACHKPALAYREDRGPWRVAVRLSDLCPGVGPLPGFEHSGVRPAAGYPPRGTLRPDPGGTEARWPGWTWTATLSVEAFCTVVRESLR